MRKVKSLLNRYLLKSDFFLRPRRCLSFPLELQLEPTNRCHLDCSVCLRKVRAREAGDMSFEDFRRIIDKFEYLKLVTLHGWGEPLLHPELFQMIDYLRRKGIGAAFATSGSMLNPDICLKLVQSDLNKLVFSIDAGATPQADAIRKNSSLNAIAQNIRYITALKKERRSVNPQLAISTTIMRENVTHLEAVIKLAKELDIPEVSFHVAYYPGRLPCEELGVGQGQLKGMLDGLTRLAKKLDIKMHYYKLSSGGRLCQSAWFMPFVASNGDVFVCCYQERPVGNILNADIRDIWNSASYQAFRRQIKKNPNDACRYCQYLHT